MDFFDGVTTLISFIRQPKKRVLIHEAWKLRGKKGIEIGGPTAFFGARSPLPVYVFCKTLDDVNYNDGNVSGENRQKGVFNYYKKKIGRQIIAEGTNLAGIPDQSYDFLLSSHSLEHIANPIKALFEWKRILKPGGTIILLLPDKRYTFDYKRPYTSFDHLFQDYTSDTGEGDQTHIEEILSTYDSSKAAFSNAEYAVYLKDNYRYRYAHHHVFSQEVVSQMLAFVGLHVRNQADYYQLHLITVAGLA